VLGSFPLILAAIYVWKAPLIFPWYWTLELCTMALFAWGTAVDAWTRTAAPKAPSAIAAVAIAAALALAAGSLLTAGAAISGHLEASPWLIENHRTRTYLTIGRALDDGCPRAVVAAPEIGALGWTFRGRILDGFVRNHLPTPERLEVAGFAIDRNAHVNVLAEALLRCRSDRLFERAEDHVFLYVLFACQRVD
jgi:hypothetical protein